MQLGKTLGSFSKPVKCDAHLQPLQDLFLFFFPVPSIFGMVLVERSLSASQSYQFDASASMELHLGMDEELTETSQVRNKGRDEGPNKARQYSKITSSKIRSRASQ